MLWYGMGFELQNKEGLLLSYDLSGNLWNFKTKDDLIYIENSYDSKVLGTTNDGKLILEDFEEGKADQLWIKGELNDEGYFTLENSKVPKVLTSISSSSFEIKGNITVSWIFN